MKINSMPGGVVTKNLLVLILGSLILNGCASTYKTVKKPGFTLESGKRAAVMQFEGNDMNIGNSLADAFITELMDMGFDVIERTQLEKILKEQKIGMTGVLDTQTIRDVGRIAGIDILVLGRFSFHKERRKTIVPGGQIVRQRGRKRVVRRQPPKVKVDSVAIFNSLSVRFVDAETGSVVISCTMQKDCPAGGIEGRLSDIAGSIKKNLERP
jgi:curli biogenesis system outer membrane secretion channel CsgG